MTQSSSPQMRRGIGRLHDGHRTLGCVGYALDLRTTDVAVELDPMPAAIEGEVFQLVLEDGCTLDCRVVNALENRCSVVDGKRIERRQRLRPTGRAHL
jgi:hypothetical protein